MLLSTSVLHVASAGDVGRVRLLLKTGADVNSVDSDGCTALMGASFGCHVKCVRLLLEAGASVDSANSDGRTTLMMASDIGDAGCVRLMLPAGADANHVNADFISIMRRRRAPHRRAMCPSPPKTRLIAP